MLEKIMSLQNMLEKIMSLQNKKLGTIGSCTSKQHFPGSNFSFRITHFYLCCFENLIFISTKKRFKILKMILNYSYVRLNIDTVINSTVNIFLMSLNELKRMSAKKICHLNNFFPFHFKLFQIMEIN